MNRIYVVLLLLLLPFSVKAADDLGPPGYSWKSCEVVKCSFLVPDGWATEISREKSNIRFTMTKRRHQQKIPPRIRINIARNVQAQTGIAPDRYLELFMKDLRHSARILKTWNRNTGTLRSVAAITLHYSETKEPTQQFSLLIVNSKTGTLYVFGFEAMSDNWDEEWANVEVVFERLRLDENH